MINELNQNVLCLSLKAKWYNMIESGEKKEEYREIKPFWEKRILQNFHIDIVRFSYGYTKRTMEFECIGVEVGKGKSEWGAPDEKVIIIKLGKRVR